MKRHCSIPIVVLAILAMGFMFSCSTEEIRNLPQEVKDMLTPDQLQTLEDHGMIINEGVNPPDIQGVYFSNYNYCTFDSTELLEGFTFDNYFWRFYDQSGNDVKLDYTAQNVQDEATGAGSFITGDSEFFSVFVELNGISFGVNYTAVMIISGRTGSGGIHDFMFGFILTDKDTSADPDDFIMMPIDSHRIVEEYDDLAEASTWPTPLGALSELEFSIKGIMAGSQ